MQFIGSKQQSLHGLINYCYTCTQGIVVYFAVANSFEEETISSMQTI